MLLANRGRFVSIYFILYTLINTRKRCRWPNYVEAKKEGGRVVGV